MPQAFAQMYSHVVFSTKNRYPFLHDRVLRDRLHAYLVGTCLNLDCPSICIGGVEDHVHILCHLGRTISIADFVHELKRESSKWFKEQSADLTDFYWQNGYRIFSIGPGQVETLMSYIVKQEEHHKDVSFQDEYRRILEKYDLECDERYVWD